LNIPCLNVEQQTLNNELGTTNFEQRILNNEF